MVTFPNMSVESFPNQVSEMYLGCSPEDGLDVMHDPKGPALQTIHDFLELTSDVILNGPVQGPSSLKELDILGRETVGELSATQRLARAMLYLESAVTTLRQVDPPLEQGETLISNWTDIDGMTGEATTLQFSCEKMGLNYGTFLNCRINPDVVQHQNVSPLWHVSLPSRHYLMEILTYGTTQADSFYASEPDTCSDEWSSTDSEDEWLDNGGKIKRVYIDYIPIFDENGVIIDVESKDAFKRSDVEYRPFCDPRFASGAEKYIEITQKLLKMFLQSVGERDSQSQP